MRPVPPAPILLSALVLISGVSAAATFTVTTAQDGHDAAPGDGACATAAGDCTLRAAVEEAEALAGADVIELARATMTLDLDATGPQAGALVLSSEIELRGAGAGLCRIRQSTEGLIFVVTAGQLTLSDVTLEGGAPGYLSLYPGGALQLETGGRATLRDVELTRTGSAGWSSVHVSGGELLMERVHAHDLRRDSGSPGLTVTGGRVTITDSLFERLTGEYGPAIYVSSAPTVPAVVEVFDSRFESCTASGFGAALRFEGNSQVLLQRCEIKNNTLSAGRDTGAIRAYNSRLVLRDCLLEGNWHRAIRSGAEDLLVVDSSFVGNSQSFGGRGRANGGAALVTGGRARFIRSEFRGNEARSAWGEYGFGGALALQSGETEIEGCHFIGNLAWDSGGAISLNASLYGLPTVSVRDSVFEGNTGRASGGAVHVANGSLSIASSSLFANATEEGDSTGGGVQLESGSLVLENSTISGNTAWQAGGGIAALSGSLDLRSCTIAGNDAVNGSGRGGGIEILGGTVVLANNLLSGNTLLGSLPDDCSGAFRSGGYNLIENIGDCLIGGITGTDLLGVDPQLGPLQDEGGPTPTQPLADTSAALDAGDPAGCLDAEGRPLLSDQRGLGPREIDGDGDGDARCDIGAYEACGEDADGNGIGDACEGSAPPEPSSLDDDPTAMPLRVERVADPELRVTWEDVAADSYTLLQGSLEALRQDGYDHDALLEGLAVPAADIAAPYGDAYFLAVSSDPFGRTSPSGRDSFGNLRADP